MPSNNSVNTGLNILYLPLPFTAFLYVEKPILLLNGFNSKTLAQSVIEAND
jgi:hypothetical protein